MVEDTFRDRVEALFRKYDEKGLSKVENLVAQFRAPPAKQGALIASLVKKYGPEPTEAERAKLLSTSSSVGTPTSPTSASGGGAAAAGVPPLSPALLQSTKTLLVKFYQKQAPEKVASVSNMLESFRGREEEMFTVMQSRYNAPPDYFRAQLDLIRAERGTSSSSDGGGSSTTGAGGGRATTTDTTPSKAVTVGGPGFPSSPYSSSAVKPPATPTKDAAQAKAPTVDLKQVLTKFYQQYAPEKVSTVDTILSSFKNDEEEMFQLMEERYSAPGYFAETRKQLEASRKKTVVVQKGSNTAANQPASPPRKNKTLPPAGTSAAASSPVIMNKTAAAPGAAASSKIPVGPKAVPSKAPGGSPSSAAPPSRGLLKPGNNDEENKAMLTQFMKERAPQQKLNIDALLTQFKGREGILFSVLEKKYPPGSPVGVTTPRTDSSKSSSNVSVATAPRPAAASKVPSAPATTTTTNANSRGFTALSRKEEEEEGSSAIVEEGVTGDNEEIVAGQVAEETAPPPPPPANDDESEDQQHFSTTVEDVWSFIPKQEHHPRSAPSTAAPIFISHKQQLTAFCRKYCPDKLAVCDALLDTFRGREHEMFVHLHASQDVVNSEEYAESTQPPGVSPDSGESTDVAIPGLSPHIDLTGVNEYNRKMIADAAALTAHYGLGPQYLDSLINRYGVNDANAVMFELLCCVFPDAVYNAFAEETQKIAFVSRRLAEFYSFHKPANVESVPKILARYQNNDLQVPLGDVLLRYYPQVLQQARVQSYTWSDILGTKTDPMIFGKSGIPKTSNGQALNEPSSEQEREEQHNKYLSCLRGWAYEFGPLPTSRSTHAAVTASYRIHTLGTTVANSKDCSSKETSTIDLPKNVTHMCVETDVPQPEGVTDIETMTEDYRRGPSYHSVVEKQTRREGILFGGRESPSGTSNRGDQRSLVELRRERQREIYGTTTTTTRRRTNPLKHADAFFGDDGEQHDDVEDEELEGWVSCRRCAKLDAHVLTLTHRLQDTRQQLHAIEREKQARELLHQEEKLRGEHSGNSNKNKECLNCMDLRRQLDTLTRKVHQLRAQLTVTGTAAAQFRGVAIQQPVSPRQGAGPSIDAGQQYSQQPRTNTTVAPQQIPLSPPQQQQDHQAPGYVSIPFVLKAPTKLTLAPHTSHHHHHHHHPPLSKSAHYHEDGGVGTFTSPPQRQTGGGLGDGSVLTYLM